MSSYDTTKQNNQIAWSPACSRDRASAERAYNSISTRGYSKDDVNLMMSDDDPQDPLRRHRNRTGQQSR